MYFSNWSWTSKKKSLDKPSIRQGSHFLGASTLENKARQKANTNLFAQFDMDLRTF